MLGRVLSLLLNNPQVIEKIAESRPIRRAAQITAYVITKAQITGQDASRRVLRSETLKRVRQEASHVSRDPGQMVSRLKRVGDTFVNEVKEGLRDGSRKIKK